MNKFDSITEGSISIAQSEVLKRKHTEIFPEHVIFGLMNNPQTYSSRALKKYTKDQVINIFKNYDLDLHNQYKNYKKHVYNMDTPAKCSKWGLNRMKDGHAYSTSTGVHKDELKEDILMAFNLAINRNG